MSKNTMRFATAIVLTALFVGCSPSEKKDPAKDLEEYTSVTKKGADQVDPDHGEQTGFWYGTIGSEKSNGVAYIRSYSDGASVITVNLNILVAEKGAHYEAFLMSQDGSKKEIDLGEVSSIIGDVRHSGSFVTTKNIEGMKSIEVRLQKGTRGGTQVVATGTVKEPAPAVAL